MPPAWRVANASRDRLPRDAPRSASSPASSPAGDRRESATRSSSSCSPSSSSANCESTEPLNGDSSGDRKRGETRTVPADAEGRAHGTRSPARRQERLKDGAPQRLKRAALRLLEPSQVRVDLLGRHCFSECACTGLCHASENDGSVGSAEFDHLSQSVVVTRRQTREPLNAFARQEPGRSDGVSYRQGALGEGRG